MVSQSFKSRRALLATQRGAGLPGHGQTRLLHQISVSNKCLICCTVFRTKFECAQHLTRSWHAGRCIRDNTLHQHVFRQPSSLHCPLCEDTSFTDYDLLATHLKDHHLPTPPNSATISIVERKYTTPRPAAEGSNTISAPPSRRAQLGPLVQDYGNTGLEAQARRISSRIQQRWESRPCWRTTTQR